MKMSDYKTFRKYLDQVGETLVDLVTIHQTDWDDLSQEDQENLTRDIVILRNMANEVKNKYFEW